jgi:hypothetical protein
MPENGVLKTLIYRQLKIQNKATYRGESAMGKVSSEGPRCCFHWGQKSRMPKSSEILENAEIPEIPEILEILEKSRKQRAKRRRSHNRRHTLEYRHLYLGPRLPSATPIKATQNPPEQCLQPGMNTFNPSARAMPPTPRSVDPPSSSHPPSMT